MMKSPQKRSTITLLVAGAAMALALPPLGVWPVAAVSLATLCQVMMRHKPATTRAWAAAGWCFGFGYFLAALHWIGFAFLVNAKSDLWMMPFALGGLAAFLACYFAAAAAAACIAVQRGVPLIAALPVAVSASEWLRGHLFTGFPWASFGMFADRMPGVEQLASLLGLYGLGFCIVLWAMLPWHLWSTWVSQKHVSWPAIVVLLALPVAWLWGELRLSQNQTLYAGTTVVRLIQPNISQSDKWREENKLRIFEQLLALSERQASTRPDIIVWPESSVPFLLDESTVGLSRIAQILGDGHSLLAGAIRREKANETTDRYFTSVLLIDSKGQVTGSYDKWRLVPGGEFLPLAWLLEPLGFSKIANLPESFSPGTGPRSLQIAGAGYVGPLICYEVIFPEHIVDPALRPEWLVNVTNDGWFGQSVGPYQHLAQARMRAIEQGLPVMRAANTGISAAIDPAGRLLSQSELGQVAVLDARLPKALAATIYARWGNGPALLLIIFLAALLTATTHKRPQN